MNDAVESRVQRIVSAVFGVPLDSVDGTTGQDGIEGWDSLAHIHLVVALEAEFSVSFTPEQALQMTTVQAICDALRAKGAGHG